MILISNTARLIVQLQLMYADILVCNNCLPLKSNYIKNEEKLSKEIGTLKISGFV